ncbi:MAG: hypothetical protein IJJ14_02825 [Coriobacteriales bacterium]|nr:hypothetical protein [Coriobacteriales bacterium]MBQ6585758.1 hypothetical protein [Coriobacteriales bacterium]
MDEQELQARKAFELPQPIKPFSLAAFAMPPIWGAGHGQFIPLLFYPLWIFVDDMIMSAVKGPNALNIVGSILMVAGMIAISFAYARISPKPAYYRVKDKVSPQDYARKEKVWDITMVALGVIMLAAATVYNLHLIEVL